MKFTKDQQKAISTIDKNLQIIACAGSGKTETIAQRVVEILKSGVIPKKVIAFTYTEKAAAELKSRILKRTKEQLGEVKGMSEMYIGTIHSWCLKVLQDLVFEYQKFSILDEIKLKLFTDKNFSRIGMKDLNMDRFKDTGFFLDLMTIIRESEISPGYTIPQEIQDAKANYENTLIANAYFDFTMIMCKAVEHLKDDALFRSRIKDHIGYLICDEYQDVNPIQEQIVQHLYDLGANICVVGDDDQTLYQWRGSDINLIQRFAKRYKNVQEVELKDNFRSSKGIIDVALTCIRNNTQRMDKEMNAKGHQKFEKGDVLYNQFESTDEEYDFIVNTVKNLRGKEFIDKEGHEPRGLDYSDCVILLRTWKKASGLKEKFEEAGIPFIVAGVNNLFETDEVKAAKSIFLYLDKKLDEDVLEDYWLSVSDKINRGSLSEAIKFLGTKFPEKNPYYERFNLQQIYWEFLDKAGIREELFNTENPVANSSGYHTSEVIFYNLGMFSQIINDFETIYFMTEGPRKLSTFLSFLHYSAEGYYPEGWLNNTYKAPNAVQIMTIYQSKGLEYPVVFIPGLNRNYLPIKGRGGRSVWHYLDSSMIKGAARYRGDVEDERRLMYVAITRSKKFLMISRAPEEGNKLYQRESIFGEEIRKSDYVFQSKNRDFSERETITPKPLSEISNISLSFSLLKAFFDCPYSFKFFSLYGFAQPLGARMGFGKSIHNALMEMHRNYLEGKETTITDIPGILDRHAHFPYAIDSIKQDMREKAQQSVTTYLNQNTQEFKNIEFAEKDIQLELGNGVLVNGRIDLIKKKNLDGSYQSTIIDFKSSENAQDYRTSYEQLSLYALGYRELTGEKADFLEIYNLDTNTPLREELLITDLENIKTKIIQAADKIRTNDLEHSCKGKDCACKFQKI